MRLFFYFAPLIILCTINLSQRCAMARESYPQIVFSGVYFAGDLQTSQTRFPYLNDKKKHRFLRDTIEKRMKDNHLKFSLIPAWGKKGQKSYSEIYHPLSLSIVITDEIHGKDVYTLRLKNKPTTIIKNYIDVGLTAIFFTPSENSDKIEYSLPVIAEDILTGDLSQKDMLADQFKKTYARAADILVKRLGKLNIRRVTGHVIQVEKNIAQIDAGTKAGILPGIFVSLPDGGTGKISKATAEYSFMSFSNGAIKEGDRIAINIVKSDADDTYQVKDVKISSKLARKYFAENAAFKSICAQWYSDFLSNQKGVVVLPPKTGALYAAGAKEGIVSAYGLEGDTFEFCISEAKNQIVVDINGLAKKMADGNSINQVWIFKAWVQQDINGNKKEVDEHISQEVIVGIKEINEKIVFRNVIQQALAKLAKCN